MKAEKILCCVFNYGRSLNAIKWTESLKDDFAVSILDTYVLDHPETNDPLCSYEGNVLFFHNIFLGGLTIEAFKLCVGGAFDFLLIINSDVEIDNDNLQRLKWRLHNMPDDIGIYEISALSGSCVMGMIGEQDYTKNYFAHSKEDFKDGCLAEGWLYGLKSECIKHILPFLSIEKNKHGWGIGGSLLSISEGKGYRNVIDSQVFAYHPKGTGYDAQEAKSEWYAFDRLAEKMGIPESFITIVYCSKKHNQEYWEYIESYFSNAMPIFEIICNTDDKKEVLRAYNEAIENSVTNGLLFLPENSRFICADPNKDLYTHSFQKLFFKNKEYGILGCAAKYCENNDIIVRNNPPVFCFAEIDENKIMHYYESEKGEKRSEEIFEDAILDGRFLAIRKDRIKHLFNTEDKLPYDTEFCLSNYLSGVKIGVTKSFYLAYWNKNEEDQAETNNLLKKYGNRLPIRI